MLVNLKVEDRPGESSNIGIDSESFASASVQARIEADLELEDMQQNGLRVD